MQRREAILSVDAARVLQQEVPRCADEALVDCLVDVVASQTSLKRCNGLLRKRFFVWETSSMAQLSDKDRGGRTEFDELRLTAENAAMVLLSFKGICLTANGSGSEIPAVMLALSTPALRPCRVLTGKDTDFYPFLMQLTNRSTLRTRPTGTAGLLNNQ